MLGYVADEAVPALLRTAAVVAYPSLDEGFGLPALEALAWLKEVDADYAETLTERLELSVTELFGWRKVMDGYATGYDPETLLYEQFAGFYDMDDVPIEKLRPRPMAADLLLGRDVTLVDIPGTYKDSPGGPFAGGKTIDRPDYRMLAAIVEGPDGNYFLKFYGPAATVEQHADGFRTMIEGMVPAK